jgi:hypothetical protein
MAKNKTFETDSSVATYLASIKDEKRFKDCTAIIEIIKQYTGLEPRMWGAAIVGFGSYHYKYESGHEGTAPLAGLSSRVNAITLYFANSKENVALLKSFGKHTTSKACIYIRRLEDVDAGILGKLAKNSVDYMRLKYPG